MNRRAQRSVSPIRITRSPVGLDEAGNYSTARDLADARPGRDRQRFLAETVDMQQGASADGAHRTPRRQPQRPRWPRAVDRRREDGPHVARRATCWSARAGAKGAQLVSVVLGTPSEGARGSTRSRCWTTASTCTGACRYCAEGGPWPRRRSPSSATGRSRSGRPWTVAVSVRRGERVRTRIDAPGELHGPLAEGATVGHASVFVDGRRVRTVALVTAARVPEAGFFRKLVHYAVKPSAARARRGRAARRRSQEAPGWAAADAARRRRRRAASAK